MFLAKCISLNRKWNIKSTEKCPRTKCVWCPFFLLNPKTVAPVKKTPWTRIPGIWMLISVLALTLQRDSIHFSGLISPAVTRRWPYFIPSIYLDKLFFLFPLILTSFKTSEHAELEGSLWDHATEMLSASHHVQFQVLSKNSVYYLWGCLELCVHTSPHPLPRPKRTPCTWYSRVELKLIFQIRRGTRT